MLLDRSSYIFLYKYVFHNKKSAKAK